jgi:hypothetical protein
MVVLLLVSWELLHAGIASRWLSEITGGSSLVDLLSYWGHGQNCWCCGWCWLLLVLHEG